MGIIVVVVIGLIAGLILSVASIVFAVPVNEKEEAIVGVLPGANCGACGFAGCSGYAAALAAGTAEVGLCSPGGPDVAAECRNLRCFRRFYGEKSCRYPVCRYMRCC